MEDSVKKGNALTKSTSPDHENLLSEQHNCKEREKSLKTNYTSPSIPLLGHDHSFTELHRCARRKQKRKKARKEKRQRRKKTEERHHVVRSNSSLSTCSINNGRRDQSHTTLVKSKNAKEKQSEDGTRNIPLNNSSANLKQLNSVTSQIIETKMFSISSCLPTEKKNIVNGRKVRFVEVRKTFIDERLNITAFRKIKKPFSQAA